MLSLTHSWPQVISPISIRVGWSATATFNPPSSVGDKVMIYYGPSIASVTTDPFSDSHKLIGGDRADIYSENQISNSFTVSGLQVS